MLRVLLSLILFLPLVNNHWFYEPYELPKTILFFILGIPLLLYALYLFILDIWLVITRKQKLRSIRIPIIYLLFLISFLFSNILNGSILYGLWGQPYRYQGIIFFLLCGSLAYVIPKAKVSVTSLSVVIASIGVISCLIIVFDTLMLFLWPTSTPSYAGRPVGTFGNPNFAAGYIALCFVFMYQAWGKKKWFLALFFFVTFTLVCTRSLSGISSFLVILVALFYPRLKKRMLLAGLFLFIIGSVMVLSYTSRTSSSFDKRSSLWEKSWLSFKDKPLMGWGLENFAEAFQRYVRPEEIHLMHIRVDKPHNDILEIMVTGGIISTLLFLFLFVAVSNLVYKQARYGGDPTFLALWLGFFTYGLWNVHSITHFILIFYSIGFLLLQYYLNKTHTPLSS